MIRAGGDGKEEEGEILLSLLLLPVVPFVALPSQSPLDRARS